MSAACWVHRRTVLLSFIASVVGVGLEALIPLLTREAVDGAVAGRTDGLWLILGVMAALGLLRFGTAFVRRYEAGRLALNVQHDLRQAVFASVTRFDGGKQDSVRTGQIASRAISDLQLVNSLLSMVPLATGSLVFAVVSLGVMLWLSPLLTVLALVVLPLVFIESLRTKRVLYPATWVAQQRASEVAQQVEETVTGVRVVKSFGQEHREVATLENTARKLFGDRLRAARLTSRPAATLAALPSLGQVGVLGVGGWLAMNGSISLGTFLAFTTYMVGLVGPARMLSSLLVSAQLARAGVERVYELIDSQPEVAEAEDAVELPEGPVAVELVDVRFGYTRDDPVLDGVSLRIEPGETLAVVGPAAPASRRSRCCCPGSTTSMAARSDWGRRAPSRTCASSGRPRCAGRSGWCSRRRSCSPTPCGPTWPMAVPMPPMRRFGPPQSLRRPRTSSSGSPTATTPGSANAACRSRAASDSASHWPERC